MGVKGREQQRRGGGGEIGVGKHPDAAAAVFGVQAAIEVHDERPLVIWTGLERFVVIAHPPGEMRGDKALGKQIGTEAVDHLGEDRARLVIRVWPGENLAGAETVRIGVIILDIRDGDRVAAPGVGDQDLAVDAEGLVKPLLIPLGTAGNIAHGIEPGLLQPPRLARPDHPEGRERTVIPEKIFIAVLVQFGDPHAVPVGRGFLRHDIHRDLGKVEIGPDADGGGDPRRGEDVPDDRHGKEVRRVDARVPGRLQIGLEIGRGVKKALVDRIDMDVLRRGVAEEDRVDQRADAFVFGHAGEGDLIRHRCVMGKLVFADRLLCLEQTRTARHADGLERGRDRETDRLVAAALVRDQEIRRERIVAPRNTFDRGIKAFHINGDIEARLRCHGGIPPHFYKCEQNSQLHYNTKKQELSIRC